MLYISYLSMLTSSDAIINPRNNGSIHADTHIYLWVIIHRGSSYSHYLLSYLRGLWGQACYLWPKCIRISFENNSNSFFANRFIFNIIAAAIAIAIFAIFTTRETFTVKLQTLWVLAIAILFTCILLWRWDTWSGESRGKVDSGRGR